jgi:hypothetical protein
MLLQNREEFLVEDASEDPIIGALGLADRVDEACQFAGTIFFTELNINS